MDYGYIREILASYIKANNRNFIIYPFGQHGIFVKYILEEYFHITPKYIVDNVQSQYNSQIISYDDLRHRLKEDDYIILTIANKENNKKMEEELLEICERQKIINLFDIYEKKYVDKEKEQIKYRLSLNTIIPHLSLNLNKNIKNYKINIVHPGIPAWNSVKAICTEFESDTCCDIKIIIGETARKMGRQRMMENHMKEEGLDYVWIDEYNSETDAADILIISNPFDQSDYLKATKDVKMVICVYFTLIPYLNNNIEQFIDAFINKMGKYNPNYYLFDTLMYKQLEGYDFTPGKLVEMGNVKFDSIFNICKEKNFPYKWRKLKEKKIILWAPSHGLDKVVFNQGLSFDLYVRKFFEYANNNKDMGFIFRPHNELIIELVRDGFWSEEDLETFNQYCEQSSNIIYDDFNSYDYAYSVSDAILTEALCGIAVSALPTLKPICILYRSNEFRVRYQDDLMDCLYSACNEEELISFFEMVKNGEDNMLEKRKEAAKKYIKHFDGKNGKRIKDFILEEYLKIIEEN